MNFADLQKAQKQLNKKKEVDVNASAFLASCSKNHHLIEYFLSGYKVSLLDNIEKTEESLNIDNKELKLTVADLLEL